TEAALFPFWSPDSRYIGFFAQGRLKKIDVMGGPPQTLCDANPGYGGTWNRDNVILFSPSGTSNVIRRVQAAGGQPSDVIKTKNFAGFPVFLPDGRHFLYFARAGVAYSDPGIYFASLDGTESRRLLPDLSMAAFAPFAPGSRSGNILFQRENSLMAQP